MCGVYRDQLCTMLGYERSKLNEGRGDYGRAESVNLPPERCSRRRGRDCASICARHYCTVCVTCTVVEKVWVVGCPALRTLVGRFRARELFATHQCGMCAAGRFQTSVSDARFPEVNKIRLLASAISPMDTIPQ